MFIVYLAVQIPFLFMHLYTRLVSAVQDKIYNRGSQQVFIANLLSERCFLNIKVSSEVRPPSRRSNEKLWSQAYKDVITDKGKRWINFFSLECGSKDLAGQSAAQEFLQALTEVAFFLRPVRPRSQWEPDCKNPFGNTESIKRYLLLSSGGPVLF